MEKLVCNDGDQEYNGRLRDIPMKVMSVALMGAGLSRFMYPGETLDYARQSGMASSSIRMVQRRTSNRSHMRLYRTFTIFLLLIMSLCAAPISAVLIEFQNCLSTDTQHDQPFALQLVPLFVDAVFNTTDPSHNLNVTVWFNVTGSTVASDPRRVRPPPPANETSYWNSNLTGSGGKIEGVPYPNGANKVTTLEKQVGFLSYRPYIDYEAFCNSLVNASCPLGPVWSAHVADGNHYKLPSFSFSHNLYSAYEFTSFAVTLRVLYGDELKSLVGCISTNVTPDVGSKWGNVVKLLPVLVLALVGFATAFAAIWSPWGTSDTFHWTTNYGRDPDLLRLVTPGFGDCLQYLQFVVLTGGLTLNYPGFYQPIVSKVSWSALMFKQKFFIYSTRSNSLVDGIYATHGNLGLDRLSQLIGIGQVDYVWTGMAIWLLAIIGVSLVFIQLGFFVRWAYRQINKTQEEDLRAKNMPFSVGNVIRIVFNYFLLPIVALSMFQLVVASKSPAYTIGLAVAMLFLIVGFAGWLLCTILSTKPKSFLFDDLPTVILYGSLYNTYSDNATSFALVPIILTFVRGVAIGGVQASGIAQVVLLTICEVITIITIHGLRPFHAPTSMNAFHTLFSIVRFVTVLLMLSFAQSLGVTEGMKGWIGYAILLMHATVILGFLLNAIMTIGEVWARLAGAGDEGGHARGGIVKVFGMRQLSRRLPRRGDVASRQSQRSNATMLVTDERKSFLMDGGKMRSLSAASPGLLPNRQSMIDSSSVSAYAAAPPQHLSSGIDSLTPTTHGDTSSYTCVPSTAAHSGHDRSKVPILGLNTAEAADPYYRPPRLTRPTPEANPAGAKSQASWAHENWPNKSPPQPRPETPEKTRDGPSIPGRNSPVLMPPNSDGSPGRSKADYTTREVDFYYGVRGPALNAKIPSRRIKTGPADPTGPTASAVGWLKSLIGRKAKEKGKGFEVVRSSRMQAAMIGIGGPEAETPPEGIPVATGGIRNGPIESDDDVPELSESARVKPKLPLNRESSKVANPAMSSDEASPDDYERIKKLPDTPPSLLGLHIPGGDIELPSRFPYQATSRTNSQLFRPNDIPRVGGGSRPSSAKPTLPRRSSKRMTRILLSRRHQSLESRDTNSSFKLSFSRSDSRTRNSRISKDLSDAGQPVTPLWATDRWAW